MGYLHGVETVEVKVGPTPIQEVKSAVIALVGTAAQGEPGVMHILRSRDDVEGVFGPATAGYTLYDAFDDIFDHTTVTVLAINVYDPAVHVGGVGDVTAADIVAAIPTFVNAFAEFGFFPKLFVAPDWSHEPTVAAEMVSTAIRCRGIAYIDAPQGLTPEGAVTFKGTFGSNRARVFHPYVEVADALGVAKLRPMSGRAAGLRAYVDKQQGYHVSTSNHVIQGVIGAEYKPSYMPNDEDTQLNYLNSQGVTSLLYWNGSGYRLFGTDTTAFPFETHPADRFEVWRRTADIIEESVEYYTVQHLGKPMFARPADAATSVLRIIQDSVNGFLRQKEADGAVIGAQVWIDLDDNPTTSLADGKLKIRYKFAVPIPLVRASYVAEMDTTLLSEAFAQIVGG